MLVDKIMAYESGELEAGDTLKLFADLVRTGKIGGLQGSYGKISKNLIEQGYISKNGKILKQFGE